MTNLHEDVTKFVDNSLKMDLNEFVHLVRDVIEMLRNEAGRVANMNITGKLVTIEPQGSATVVGDLHGDLDSLATIIKKSRFLERVRRRKLAMMIFLGDYGDRGNYSPEVYYVALSLKMTFPENIILMRGNHEGPDDLLASPHDLPYNLHTRFGTDWVEAYSKLKELFGQLYNAVIVKDRCVMLHGGVPSQAKSLESLAFAHVKHPSERTLEEILWNDPEEDITGIYPSPRGAGNLFGEDVTRSFLDLLNVKALVRGHEPCDQGYKINHKGRVLTLFSRKGEPYLNRQGAYLQFDLANQIKDAVQLQSHVRLF